jgi:dTDP-4-dehydrorhamnose 3,5-epimerase
VIFQEVALKGAFVVEPAPVEDERGFFARTWCFREFEAQGLETAIAQCSISFNRMKGALRGMHFQAAPHKEAKLVRCTMGSIYDVIIDLRVESPTYKQYVAEILSAENRKMLYIPEGFAHGFLTLENCTEVFYQISTFYASEYARGVRWNDPAFGIPWPSEIRVISERDKNYPDFKE